MVALSSGKPAEARWRGAPELLYINFTREQTSLPAVFKGKSRTSSDLPGFYQDSGGIRGNLEFLGLPRIASGML